MVGTNDILSVELSRHFIFYISQKSGKKHLILTVEMTDRNLDALALYRKGWRWRI